MKWRELLDSPIAWGLVVSLIVAGLVFLLTILGSPPNLPSGTFAGAMAWGVICWLIKDTYFKRKK